jgi:hypothetical protein
MNDPLAPGPLAAADVRADWDPNGSCADLYQGAVWIGSLRLLDAWFTAGSRIPQKAWVVEWQVESRATVFERALVELGASSALDEERKADLARRARALIGERVQSSPAPFGAVSTDLDSSQGLRDRIEAISHALQAAQHRLGEDARITEEWGGVKVLTSLTEALAWLRALDEVLRFTWQQAIHPTLKEVASKQIDDAISRRKELPDFVQEAFAERQLRGSPYTDWTLLLLDRGLALSPGDLRGLRWLAGKMLHLGPVPAVELTQLRPGVQPRWTWRRAEEIFPNADEDLRLGQRRHYEANLAGRSMLSKFKLTLMLIEAELLFCGLIRKSEDADLSYRPSPE